MGKMSKNNVTGVSKKRYLGDKVVVPTLYDGRPVKKGSFMAGMVDNELVWDENNDRPLPLKEIGEIR